MHPLSRIDRTRREDKVQRGNADGGVVRREREREREREKVLGAPIYSAETEENARSHRECEAACHHESLSRL